MKIQTKVRAGLKAPPGAGRCVRIAGRQPSVKPVKSTAMSTSICFSIAAASASPAPHELKAAFVADNYENAKMIPITRAHLSAGFTRLDPKSIQPNIDLALKYGLLSRSFPAGELTYQP